MIERTIDQYTPGDFVEDWDMGGLYTAIGQFFPLDLDGSDVDGNASDRNGLIDRVVGEAMERYEARRAGTWRGADGSSGALPAAADHR